MWLVNAAPGRGEGSSKLSLRTSTLQLCKAFGRAGKIDPMAREVWVMSFTLAPCWRCVLQAELIEKVERSHNAESCLTF
jgi:hypothetical protein